MSYTVCPDCGQKALSVATRCPRCGRPFETQFYQPAAAAPSRKRIPRSMLVVGLVLAGIVGNAAYQFTRTARPRPAPVEAAMSPPPERPPERAPQRAAPAVVTPQPETVATSAPRISADTVAKAVPADTAQVRPESPRTEPVALSVPAAAAALTQPPAGGADERRYATTWLNVRARRSNASAVLRVLRPGEAVRVDSLGQGWYRVLSGEEPIGYADRRLLDTSPPTDTP